MYWQFLLPVDRVAYRRDMDHQSEVRDFLTTRRARLDPDQVGLPHFAGRRRVPGLRREEVAMLTGVSTEYYARLERGHLAGVSDQVLDALARGLRLDESERAHLLDLARAAAPAQRPPRATPRRTPRPGLQRLLDAMDSTPAYVRTGHLDIVAANRLGRALFSDIFTTPDSRPNLTRYIFLDPRARDFYREWDTVARDIVAAMRSEAGRNPHDRTLSNLVGELFDPQRRVPHLVGRPRSPHPPLTPQARPPPRRGRPGLRRRRTPATRRHRAHAHRLHLRASKPHSRRRPVPL